MTSNKRTVRRQPSRRVKEPSDNRGRAPEADPAVERGERIDTGKTIARGGKTHGEVPGAEPDDR